MSLVVSAPFAHAAPVYHDQYAGHDFEYGYYNAVSGDGYRAVGFNSGIGQLLSM